MPQLSTAPNATALRHEADRQRLLAEVLFFADSDMAAECKALARHLDDWADRLERQHAGRG
jgi:hypothetical protein